MEKAVAAWGHPRKRSSSFAAMNGPGNRWGATNPSQRLRGYCVERSGGESRVPKQSQRESMDKSGVPGIPPAPSGGRVDEIGTVPPRTSHEIGPRFSFRVRRKAIAAERKAIRSERAGGSEPRLFIEILIPPGPRANSYHPPSPYHGHLATLGAGYVAHQTGVKFLFSICPEPGHGHASHQFCLRPGCSVGELLYAPARHENARPAFLRS